MISDVHGNHLALAAVLDRIVPRTQAILFLGDLCGYYPFVNDCVTLLDGLDVLGVRGNHDEAMLACLRPGGVDPDRAYESLYGTALRRSLPGLSPRATRWLLELPLAQRTELAGCRCALFHGAPWDPLEGRVYPDFTEWARFEQIEADVVLLGHTHYPLLREYRGTLIVNPGSVGQARDREPGACYAILDTSTRSVEFGRVPFDPKPLIADAIEHDPQLPFLAEVLLRT